MKTKNKPGLHFLSKITLLLLIANSNSLVYASEIDGTQVTILSPDANSGRIADGTLFLNEKESDGISGILKKTTLSTLNQTQTSGLNATGVASGVKSPPKILTAVVGGSPTGDGSGVSSNSVIYSGNIGTINYINPAPKWMSNIIVGACNNPTTTTVNGQAKSSCPKNNAGYMVNDSTHFFRFFCGATLINEEWVMSAAHCLSDLTDDSGNPLTIAFASVQTDDTTYYTDQQGRKVYNSGSGLVNSDLDYRDYADMFVIHPDYNPSDLSLGHDIALLRLTNPLYVGSRDIPVSPVEISSITTYNSSYSPGYLNKTYGWGVTNPSISVYDMTSADLSQYLMSGSLPYVRTNIANHIIWAGGDGQDTCNGDSGGPLLANGVQIGITSYGTTTYCGSGQPGAYTDVGAEYSWIVTLVNTYTKSISSCMPGADCYVNGTLQVDYTSPDTTTSVSVSSSGGGSMGIEFIAPLGLLALLRRKLKKGK